MYQDVILDHYKHPHGRGLRDGDAECDGDGEAHAAEHVEILRTLATRPQIEVGVADAADDRLVSLELGHQPLRQVEAVHHLGVMRADGSRRFRGHGHLNLRTLSRR